MFKQILALLTLLPAGLFAQNIPACDSLLLDCCYFNTAENTIIINAENQSSWLFPYPGFLILDPNHDTIAKETVFYFGIGWGPQEHNLEIYSPPVLPFYGQLKLFSWFYDSLNCSFDLFIPDTLTSGYTSESDILFQVSPNPGTDRLRITANGALTAPVMLEMMNASGTVVLRSELTGMPSDLGVIDISHFNAGIYLMRIKAGNEYQVKKIIKR